MRIRSELIPLKEDIEGKSYRIEICFYSFMRIRNELIPLKEDIEGKSYRIKCFFL